MKKILTTGTLFVGLLLGAQARAEGGGGLYFEPGVTYTQTDTTVDWPILSDSTGTNKGLGAVAKIGLHASEIVFLGADVRYAQTRITDSAFNTDTDATGYNYGVAAGIQMPVVGLRLLGSYILGGELDPKEDKGIDVKFKEPKGYRLGVGFQIIMLSLNVEYQDMKYDKSDIKGVVNNTESVQATEKGWIASLTFPMEF